METRKKYEQEQQEKATKAAIENSSNKTGRTVTRIDDLL